MAQVSMGRYTTSDNDRSICNFSNISRPYTILISNWTDIVRLVPDGKGQYRKPFME